MFRDIKSSSPRRRDGRVLAIALGLLVGACPACDNAAGVVARAERDVEHTDVALDLEGKSGVATVTLTSPPVAPLMLETGDLVVHGVTADGVPLAFTYGEQAIIIDNSDSPARAFEISYDYQAHGNFDGADERGYLFTWPYFCGNVFPCVSDPHDGMTFALAVSGVSAGDVAVHPSQVAQAAPSYMLSFAIDQYVETELGTTSHGTHVLAWHRAAHATATMEGTVSLVDSFEWLESTLGAYVFGDRVGSVIVRWGDGAYGGMEHHPLWHVAESAAGDEVTHVHEAAHGWFGNGVRVACWEDFVLSEGTVSYLAARAIEQVRGAKRAAEVWAEYANELDYYRGRGDPVWLVEWATGCNQIDILNDGLYTGAPYMRGAFFYKGLADRLGAEVVDQALASFYQAHVGQAARMQDMLDHIETTTGYDPSTCAQAWLRDLEIPAIAPCP
ncbi:MAG: peptidase M1 [Myxococcales bacterium]|nr:peptidase M1 [Myxococcales bacterium]